MLHWTTDLNLTFSISCLEKNQETHGMEVLHQPNDRPLTAGNTQNATSPYISTVLLHKWYIPPGITIYGFTIYVMQMVVFKWLITSIGILQL